MEIKPTYVSFEQAKLLKEKGFDVPTLSFYVIDESEYGDLGEFIQNPNDNFPSLDDNTLFDTLASAPEQWQVCEWLRVNHGIHVQYLVHGANKTYAPFIVECKTQPIQEWFNSPQESYSNAFDYILNNLI